MTTKKTILSTWPIFAGILLLVLGNGLQATLLGVRGALIGFDTATLSIVLATYYVGYLSGCIITPKLIKNVGHIRVYAAFASCASAVALIYTLSDSPIAWAILRGLNGFSFAAIFIISESWLNATSTKKNRGQVLSIYMVTVFIALTGAQLLLNVADPTGYQLFVLNSVVLSLAIIPLSLSKRPQPKYEAPKSVSISHLIKLAPLGILGCFVAGMTSTTFLVIAPIYGVNSGMTPKDVSFFMAMLVISGMLLQYPVGWLSDKIDRRKVLAIILFGICLAGTAAGMLTMHNVTYFDYLAITLMSGLMLTIYSVSATHVNDRLNEEEIVQASATLILINGTGALIGPIIVGSAMSLFGQTTFFFMPPIFCLITLVFAMFRIGFTDAVAPEDRGDYIALPDKPSYITAQMAAKASQENTSHSSK